MMFFFDDTATTEIYTLSLHDALPILAAPALAGLLLAVSSPGMVFVAMTVIGAWSAVLVLPLALRERRRQARIAVPQDAGRSEVHTAELQSRQYLVCRLLLEKKKHKWG